MVKNKKTKNGKMCKTAKKTSGMIQGTAKLSQRDAYQKFLNSPKVKNAKTSGAGWGGEAPTKKKKSAGKKKMSAQQKKNFLAMIKKGKSKGSPKGAKPPVMANGRMKTKPMAMGGGMPIKVM